MLVSTFAEATSCSTTTGASLFEQAAVTEAAVLQLFNDDLKVAITSQDISSAHRLPQKTDEKTASAPIIVRFSNLKTRDAAYRARLTLKDRSGTRHL